MIVVLATFDGDTSEVFGPFDDSNTAHKWINSIEVYFTSRDAIWVIVSLSTPLTPADLLGQISGSEGS